MIRNDSVACYIGFLFSSFSSPVSEDKGFLFAKSDSAVITYAYDVPG